VLLVLCPLVNLHSYASCGTCPHCVVGKPAYCYDHGSINFGGTHPDGTLSHSKGSEKIFGSFFRQSSLATHALAAERNVIKVNSWVRSTGSKPIDLASLAPLGCGVQTGAGAVMNTLRASAGSTLAVFGCGGVGLSAVMAAKVVGCGRVIAVDLTASRLALAQKFGATHTVLVQRGEPASDISKRVREASGNIHSGVDYALDTTGNPTSLRSAFDSLKPLGVAGLIGGANPGTEVSVDMLSMLPGKQLRGVIQGDAVSHVFIPQLLELYAQGRFPFDELITYYNGLQSINQAFADAHTAKVVKPVIRIASA